MKTYTKAIIAADFHMPAYNKKAMSYFLKTIKKI